MNNTKPGPNLNAVTKTLYEDLLLAWNGCNADDFARLFSVNGNMIGFDGSQANGFAEISQHLTKIFADHRTGSFIGIIKEVRQIAETVFVLRAVAGIVPAGEKDINPDLNCL